MSAPYDFKTNNNTTLAWASLVLMSGIIIAGLIAIIYTYRCNRLQSSTENDSNDTQIGSDSDEGSVYQNLSRPRSP